MTNATRRTRLAPATLWLLAALAAPLLLPARAAAQGYAVEGHAIAVSLAPDSPTIMLGEPVFLTFEVRNLSGHDLQLMEGGDYRNKYGRPDSFKLSVTSDEGRPAPRPEEVNSMGGLYGPRPVSAGGSHATRLLLQHWVSFDAPGSYTVTCRKTLSMSAAGVKTEERDGWRQVAVEATTRIRVVPGDDAALGVLIARLGRALREAASAGGSFGDGYQKGREAMSALAYIEDGRVVPHLAAVLKAGTARPNHFEFAAARALSKFDADAALAALEGRMRDPSDTMRAAVAVALSASRHPSAFGLLLSMRGDTHYGVRLTVVHALGRARTPRSSELLREMSKDGEKVVREEAARYLRERGEQD